MTTAVAPRRARPSLLPAPRVDRRLFAVWGFAILNVLPYAPMALILPIPSRIGQMVAQAALGAAFLLAVTINPGRYVRPNLFLGLYTILGIAGLTASVRAPTIGYDIRALRFVIFVAMLWLLTPFWGLADLTIARLHQRWLMVLVGVVLLGLVLAPGKALAFDGRLQGTIWPMAATQVAHYGGTLVGMTAILWMCRLVPRRAAVLTILAGLVTLLLTHTRTALIALLVGLALASLSLFVTNRRVRRAFTVTVLVIGVSAIAFTPMLVSWMSRGQDASQISNLTGRTKVWNAIMETPRPLTDRILGSGVSNGSFDGLPIDNSWLTVYVDQGILGGIIVAAALLTLVVMLAFRPPTAARAMALFLVAYCFIASFTEAGLGSATPYLLDLTVAASLLATDRAGRST